MGRDESFTEADLQRIRRAFPEAEEVMISKNEKFLDEKANTAEPWPLLEDVRAPVRDSQGRYYLQRSPK